MPSPSFVVKLRPDLLMHRVIICTGMLAMLVGVIILSGLRFQAAWRCLLTIVWVLDCLFEFRRLASGIARVRLISLESGGTITALEYSGDTVALRLRSGSFVLSEIAWLRLNNTDGRYFAGLFVRRRIGRLEWHRLQLLWQQSRHAFGHMAGP